jgi:hypothetical protein
VVSLALAVTASSTFRLCVRATLLAAVIALAAAGCSSGGSDAASSAAVIARPSSTGQLMIMSPKNGQVFHSTDVPVKVMLHDAKIVPATSTNVVPDEGHLHISLDGEIVSMNLGLTDQLQHVAPGIHVVQVEFVASDHLPFNPRVIQQVTFEVRR